MQGKKEKIRIHWDEGIILMKISIPYDIGELRVVVPVDQVDAKDPNIIAILLEDAAEIIRGELIAKGLSCQ